MKNITTKIKCVIKQTMGFALMFCGGFVLFASPAFAQCDEDKFVDNCAVNLGDDYGYLRTFDVEEIEGSTNYPYTGAFLFRKGISYVFASCSSGAENAPVVVNLYNRTRKLVASTYNADLDKHYEKMVFKCSATGIFFVQSLMPMNAITCGITMLGFNAQ